jgi:hypothetical protein
MTEHHEHHYTEDVLIPDGPHSDAEAIQARGYDKGRRWIKARQCECGAVEAYDLTHEGPLDSSQSGVTSPAPGTHGA